MIDRSLPIRLAPSTVALAVVVLVGMVCAVLLALNLTNVLVTVFLAIVLAETIRPMVVAFEHRGVPRPLAIAAIYLTVLALAAGSLALILPPFLDQVRQLVREAPQHFEELQVLMPEMNQALIDLGLMGQVQMGLGQFANQAAPILRTVAALPVQVFTGIVTVLTGFVLAAFWIGLTEAVDAQVIDRLPVERRVLIRSLASDLSATLGGWLRGQLVLMLFVGTLSFIGLLVLGVRYPVALAVWAGVTEIFPLIGPWVGGVPAVLIAGLDSPGRGMAVFILYIVVQQIENNFLVPKVMQRAVGLHPFVVLVALLAGGSLLGVAGIIISVPLAAAVQVVVSRLWLSRLVPAAHLSTIEETLARIPSEPAHGDEPAHGEPVEPAHGEPVEPAHGEPVEPAHGEPVEPRPSTSSGRAGGGS